MKFAERLQALRKMHRLTQKELSEKLRVSEAYVSALETGRKLPSYLTTMAIGRILGDDLQELLALVEQDKVAQAKDKAQRRHVAYIADHLQPPNNVPATVSTAVEQCVQRLSTDPRFLRAVLELMNARDGKYGKRGELVLQLLEELAHDGN